MCLNCPHEMWDHEFIDESNDCPIFGHCEVEGCTCECFEEGGTQSEVKLDGKDWINV